MRGWLSSGMAYARIIAAMLLLGTATLAGAFEFEPVKPLDTAAVEPALLANVYGAWEIRDRAGRKRCRIVLLKDFGIGGYQIEVAPDCAKTFPVMDDITAWRLLEGWTIDLVDGLRKIRIRFSTPDNRYVVFGDPKDVAGMDDLRRLPDTATPNTRK
jgi:hypothetical protein